MTECWQEGALRAYLDRELPTEDMQKVAAHLGECTACDNLCTELAARAAHVSALMELLPEWRGALPHPATQSVKKAARQTWIPIAVTLAACLALAAYLIPEWRQQETARMVPVPVAPAPPQFAEAASVVAPPAVEQAEVPRRAAVPRRARRVRPPVPEADYFVALDDEPFESGVIMRVDVKPGNVQADVVFGPDGRAHAFRLVNASQRN